MEIKNSLHISIFSQFSLQKRFIYKGWPTNKNMYVTSLRIGDIEHHGDDISQSYWISPADLSW